MTRVPTVQYVSPAGNDTALGNSPGNPKATVAAAAKAMGGGGTIYMLAGDYEQQPQVDLAACPGLTIAGTGSVEVLMGEKLNSGFTVHTGTTYKKDITTVIPADNDTRQYVFEWNTPEGALDATNAPFAPAGRTHRLQHFRLQRGASANSLNAGEYFFNAPTLYIRRTDNADPNGKDHWVPSQSRSFVSGATSITKLTVSGINLRFGLYAADVSNAGTYSFEDCLFFGSGSAGLNYNGNSTTGTETDCEYAGNANDGRAITCANAGTRITSTVTRPWAHDNGDEGVSDHNVGSFSTYSGGLYEYNTSSGSTWVQNAPVVFTNPVTRGNPIGLGASINQTAGTVTGWTSIGDTYAASATSNSTLTLSSPTITAPVTAAYYAGSPGDVINASNASGSTTTAGGGTVNFT